MDSCFTFLPRKNVYIIPFKDPSIAKRRLRNKYSPKFINFLVKHLLKRSVNSIKRNYIVLASNNCAYEFLKQNNFNAYLPNEHGLNEGLTELLAVLRICKFERMTVVPCDLVFPEHIKKIKPVKGSYIVPDKALQGTNFLSIELEADFEFSFGLNSFKKHLAMLNAKPRAVRTITYSKLRFDVDTPEDLIRFRREIGF